jgi:hypothetical protein
MILSRKNFKEEIPVLGNHILYHKEPTRWGGDGGGFWYGSVREDGRPFYQVFYVSCSPMAKSALPTAAKLYRNLRTAGALGPEHIFCQLVAGIPKRSYTKHEEKRFRRTARRMDDGTCTYSRRREYVDDPYIGEIITLAAAAYSFLIDRGQYVTFKQWAKMIRDHYDNDQAREVARVLDCLHNTA